MTFEQKVFKDSLKQPKTTCCSIPTGLGSILKKCMWTPFLTNLRSKIGRFEWFWELGWVDVNEKQLKIAQNHFFELPLL